jgi:hypothetical protein
MSELSPETVEHLRVVRKVLKAQRASLTTAIGLLAEAEKRLVADCPELLEEMSLTHSPEGGIAHGSRRYAAEANGRR